MRKQCFLFSLTPLKILTLLLSIALLFCSGGMSKVFCFIIRLFVTLLAAVWWLQFKEEDNAAMKVFAIDTIILYQPIYKIPLGYDTWRFAYLVTAILLIALVVVRVYTKMKQE